MSGWHGVALGAACLATLGWIFHHYLVRLHDARAWLSKGGILVDVDPADEFVRHHPRVALGIPLEDLARRAHEVGSKDRPVVVFAHSWQRGARAVHDLRGMGFREVMSAAGLHTKETLCEADARGPEARQEPADLIELSRITGGDFGASDRDRPANPRDPGPISRHGA